MARSRSNKTEAARNVLVGITASIAAYKAYDIISILRKKGFSVRCALTEDARHFVSPLVLETLSGHKAATEMFKLPEERTPEHISLADEADIILVTPATADIIGKIAAGICDDILTCTICASACPVVFAPAMNENMFKNPIIQDKITYLKAKGYHFIDPIKGHLACGREGIGHLAMPEDIVNQVEILTR